MPKAGSKYQRSQFFLDNQRSQFLQHFCYNWNCREGYDGAGYEGIGVRDARIYVTISSGENKDYLGWPLDR